MFECGSDIRNSFDNEQDGDDTVIFSITTFVSDDATALSSQVLDTCIMSRVCACTTQPLYNLVLCQYYQNLTLQAEVSKSPRLIMSEIFLLTHPELQVRIITATP